MRRWTPPKTKSARKAIVNRCGNRCFLLPGKLGFPVCDPHCRPSCSGLRAAFSRAQQTGRGKVARRALIQACHMKCTWTKRRGRCER
jgi:hypothetical protein